VRWVYVHLVEELARRIGHADLTREETATATGDCPRGYDPQVNRPPADPGASHGLSADAVVGVVGAGTMGAAIAEVAARAGHRVLVFDADPEAARRAVAELQGRLARDDEGGLTSEESRTVAGRLTPAALLQDLKVSRLVIESVPESLAAKREVLAQIEAVVDDDTVLATNTSSLSVTAIAGALRRPGRVVGMHFFNPATRMRLVEVVPGADTGEGVVSRVTAVARAWGKTPVRSASTPGFIVNRVARPFYGEAQRIVEEGGAPPAVVDLVLRDVGGFPMGAFELTDLVGHDVNLAVSRSVWEQTFHDPRYAPTVLQQRLVDAGRLGRKTGRGVYRYGEDVALKDGPRPGVAYAPRHLAPASVRYRDGWSVMSPLLERISAGGVEIRQVDRDGPDCTDDVGLLLPSGGRLLETSGLRALDIGSDVVALDWARDPETTGTVAIAPSATCTFETVSEACGTLQAAGVEVIVLTDSPGLVVARTVAMIVNEAADLVARGEATAADVDTAMQLGAGYPEGPLAWGDAIGAACVAEVIESLHSAIPTGRYRVCNALHLAAETGSPLRTLTGRP